MANQDEPTRSDRPQAPNTTVKPASKDGLAGAKARAARARSVAKPAASATRPADLTAMLLPVFHAEAEERLSEIEANLTSIESSTPGADQQELFQSVMRNAHSIKGGARTVKLEHLEAIGKSFEGVALGLRDGQIPLSPELIATFRSTVDTIRTMLGAPTVADPAGVNGVLTSLRAYESGAPIALPPARIAVVAPPLPAAAPQPAPPSRAVWFVVAGRSLAVPTFDVERVLRVRTSDIRGDKGGETILFNDEPLPLVRLEKLLKLEPAEPRVALEAVTVLVVLAEGRLAALLVDSVEDELAVEAKGKSELGAFASVGVMIGTGETVPFLETRRLLDAVLGAAPAVADVVATGPTAVSRGILVAEDSATSRILLKELLESAGYEVTTAVDGAEALSLLEASAIDLVVSDVEMPNLDGFQLTERIRNHPRHGTLPVILVTGRERPQDREKGMGAGASAYFVKSKFDEEELLAEIERLL